MAAGVLALTRRHLVGIDVEETELDEITDHAESITVGSDSLITARKRRTASSEWARSCRR